MPSMTHEESILRASYRFFHLPRPLPLTKANLRTTLVDYNFDEDDITKVKAEVKRIQKVLGVRK